MKIYSVYTQKREELFIYEGQAKVFSTYEKAKAYIESIVTEYVEQGDFDNWEDVEYRYTIVEAEVE